jgi:hypothetical protein
LNGKGLNPDVFSEEVGDLATELGYENAVGKVGGLNETTTALLFYTKGERQT